MKLCHIFKAAEEPHEGLWALKYEGFQADEFNRVFNDWGDPE